jgi:hypothetical protein
MQRERKLKQVVDVAFASAAAMDVDAVATVL